MDIDKALKSTEESYTYPFNPAFFFSCYYISPEIFPKHKGYIFVSESIA